MLVAASGMHYTTSDGRQILDGTAGLWCCNAGHARPLITEAIQKQVTELDYAPAFQMGHPKAFELANRLVDMAPRRHGPRVFHQFRVGKRGNRAENRHPPIIVRLAMAPAPALSGANGAITG